MARPYVELQKTLRAKLTPEEQVVSDQWVGRELKKIALDRMRKARNLTQQSVALELGIDQGAVSRIEKRADMYISTLRSYVEAVGGRLELHAVFPGETLDLRLAGKRKTKG
jgi:predicted transcriptional regulator